jgi:hypothetical protein
MEERGIVDDLILRIRNRGEKLGGNIEAIWR